LTYRDMRQVLSDTHQVPSIEYRRHCIVVCLPPVTAILLHNRAYILVNDDIRTDAMIRSLTQISDEHFSGKLSSKPRSTFEFAALEILISTAFSQLNQDILELEKKFDATKKILNKGNITVVDLEKLYNMREIIQKYCHRVNAFDKAFDKLIATPEDVKRMELTKYRNDPLEFDTLSSIQANSPPYPDLEILLEYFDQELEQFNSRVNQLLQSIDNADRLITLRLALIRNRLIYFDLGATIATCGTSIGTCISGVFGMNLTSGLEESYEAFVLTSVIIALIFFLSLVLVVFVWWKFRL